MTEPTITCPHCKTEIKLTEPLAAPLVEFKPIKVQQESLARYEVTEPQRNALMIQVQEQFQQLVEELMLFTIEWELR